MSRIIKQVVSLWVTVKCGLFLTCHKTVALKTVPGSVLLTKQQEQRYLRLSTGVAYGSQGCMSLN